MAHIGRSIVNEWLARMVKNSVGPRIVKYNESGRRIGESHPKAKMTDEEVDICFDLHEKGFGTRLIHRITGFPRSTICDVLSCRTRSQPTFAVKKC